MVIALFVQENLELEDCALITATRPDESEDSSVTTATKGSVFSTTIQKDVLRRIVI